MSETVDFVWTGEKQSATQSLQALPVQCLLEKSYGSRVLVVLGR